MRVIDYIGNTPMVRLENIFDRNKPGVFVKLEGFNPGGSVKSRPGIQMVLDAKRNQAVQPVVFGAGKIASHKQGACHSPRGDTVGMVGAVRRWGDGIIADKVSLSPPAMMAGYIHIHCVVNLKNPLGMTCET